jgi:hypothetical protein
MISAGKGFRAIAKRLGRTRASVWGYAYGQKLSLRNERKGYWFSLDKVSKLFGISLEQVQQIVEWAEIKALPGKVRGRNHRYLTRDDIESFIENSDYWMLWEPDRITDHDVKSYALELREQAGWCWLTAKETAYALGYKNKYQLSWPRHIRRVGLPVRRVGGRYWFKSTEVEAVAAKRKGAKAA